jgi:hypothetical protein
MLETKPALRGCTSLVAAGRDGVLFLFISRDALGTALKMRLDALENVPVQPLRLIQAAT